MSASLHGAYDLARAGYVITPNYVVTEGGCSCGCSDPTCRNWGKHPIGGDTKHATKDAQTIRGWLKNYRAGFNIGIQLEQSDVVDLAPDSPEWDAEFHRRGLPDGALIWHSGSGAGHKHYVFRRPADCPVTKINRSGEFDIMAIGMAAAPPSVSGKGPYTWDGAIIPRDELPEAPAWAVAMLREQGEKRERTATQTQARADSAGDADGDPHVRLTEYGLRRWREGPGADADDRSGYLWEVGCLIDEAGGTEAYIAAALQDLDQRHSLHKYTDRPAWYAITAQNIMNRERKPEPIVVLGSESTAGPCSDQVAALQARIDQLHAHNAHLKSTLAEAQARFHTVLALDRNPHIKAQRTTAKAVAWEISSAVETGKADADGWVKVWRDGIAQNAGISPKQAGAHIKTLERGGLIDKKVINELATRPDPETGELVPDYSEPPKPRMYLRLRGTLSDYLDQLTTWEPKPLKPGAARWGGKREAQCSLHPNAGTITRWTIECAECRAVLDEGTDAPAEPVSQDDSLGDEATTTPGPSTLVSQDDPLGQASLPLGQDEPLAPPAPASAAPAAGLPFVVGMCAQCQKREPNPYQRLCQSCVLANLKQADWNQPRGKRGAP